MNNDWMPERTSAIALLKKCVIEAGFVAAAENRENYHRVWSRDGNICGLAALTSGDQELIEAFKSTLQTLAQYQGEYGQIPSNVDVAHQKASYGTDVGRIDPTIWFIIGVCLFGRLTENDTLVDELWQPLQKAHDLLCAWEINNSGLLYVPQGGDWADQFLLSGYLLYDQVLRLWAMKELTAAAQRLKKEGDTFVQKAQQIESVLSQRFFPDSRRPYFLAGYRPGATYSLFDAFGNAVGCLLGLASLKEREHCLTFAEHTSSFQLVSAFFPAIEPDDPRYQELIHIVRHRKLRNLPGRYHNGGLWPMITGFWALAARKLENQTLADWWTAGIVQANQKSKDGFYEYLDARTGEPGGARNQAWSAAAMIIATRKPASATF